MIPSSLRCRVSVWLLALVTAAVASLGGPRGVTAARAESAPPSSAVADSVQGRPDGPESATRSAGAVSGVGEASQPPPSIPAAGTVTRRSAFSRTESNGDGSYTSTFATRPLHWKAPATGEWREFVNTLRPVPATLPPGFSHENTANRFLARFGEQAAVVAGQPVLRFTLGALGLDMTAVAAAPTSVTVQGTKITYVDAYPNVDLRFTVDNERVKEELVLKRAPLTPAEARFQFQLALDGLTAHEQPTGTILFKEGTVTRMEMPRLSMIDSASDLEIEVPAELTELAAGRLLLTVTPDLEWLQDPDRTYPVVIDPSVSVTEIQPEDGRAQNVTIDQANPTKNYHGNTRLIVGKNGTGQRQDALLRFPSLDTLPTDSAVVRAQLELKSSSSSDDDVVPVEVRHNTAAFTASTVTWNTAPASGSEVWATKDIQEGQENLFDLTALVRKWVRGELEHYGMRLVSAGANGEVTRHHSSYSSCTGGSCRPELQVSYVPATRYGVNRLWTYSSAEHGGGNSSRVNVSTGNLVFSHAGGAIDTRGFRVELSHTYNSQDPFYLADYPGAAVYGQGWQFAHNLRLFELDSGNAVVFKDGTGDQSRVFLKSTDSGSTRSYLRPVHYGHSLTKDLGNPPADPAKVFTLVTDHGQLKYYFNAAGRLTRQQDRNGNYLAYTYDGSGRLWKITDVAGRVTTLEYLGSGGRLSKITDMALRVSTYGYSSGNLTTIKHAVATPDEVTTILDYDDANQLVSVKNPRGHTSFVRYRTLNSWETAGSVEDWDVQSRAAISHSTSRAHGGTGSLKVDLADVGDDDWAIVEKDLNDSPRALSSTSQELVVWVYLPAGSGALQARTELK